MRGIKNRNFIVLVIIFISFIIGVNSVNAVTIKRSTTNSEKSNSQITGSGWGNKSMTYKGIDKAANRNAFCTTFNHPSDDGFVNGSYTKANCDASGWFNKVTEANWITAGQIVDVIASDVSNADNRYVYTVLTLNTFFKNVANIEGAVDFRNISKSQQSKYGVVSDNLKDKIKNWIETARERKNLIQASKTINKPGITNNGSTTLVSYNNGQYFMSGQINFSQSGSLSNGTAINNTISVSSLPNATVQLCDANGNNCSASKNSAGTYRVKVTPNGGASVSGIVSATITSQANTFSWHYGVAVCHTTTKSNQAMLITKDDSAAPNSSNTINLKVPTSKGIQILKIDENGSAVSGSVLELYDENNSKINLTNNGTSFSYTSADDNFSILGKKFSIKEVTTPNGYVTQELSDITIPTSNGATCYQVSDDSTAPTKVSLENCDAVAMCKLDGEIVEMPEDGDCNSLLPEPTVPTDPTTDSSSSTTDTGAGSDSTTGSSSTEGSEEETPEEEHTVENVCVVNNKEVDNEICQNKYTKVEVNGNSVLVTFTNILNTVNISKKAATGEDEVVGAKLKICTEEEYKKDGNDCTPAKTIKDVELSWTSSSSPKVFRGLSFGKYYIIETVPPLGYKLVTTATEFSIDESGNITTGEKKVDDNVIVINNALNEMTVSKVDSSTSKELSGAQLAICLAGEKSSFDDSNTVGDDSSIDTTSTDGTTTTTSPTSSTSNTGSEEDTVLSTNPDDYAPVLDATGDCIPATLQDGSGDAVWVSTDQPYKIQGLSSGIYYLVETTAPSGYSTSESILFKMNDNGEITDIEGNPISDNKLVMKDDAIADVKTGRVVIIIAVFVGLGAIGLGTYYYSKVNGGLAFAGNVISGKIRKRKIHK